MFFKVMRFLHNLLEFMVLGCYRSLWGLPEVLNSFDVLYMSEVVYLFRLNYRYEVL